MILLFALPVIYSSQSRCQPLWQNVTAPTTAYLRSLCFTDSLHGWAAGDSGTIIHTHNGGKTWALQYTGTDYPITCVFFNDSAHGWASALNYSASPFGTLILNTTDGGSHWTIMQYPVYNFFISCILFTDSLNGWVGGRPNGIHFTNDGGITWTPAVIDTSVLAFMPVLDIRFWDDKYGYASGGIHDVAGVIWRTNNGGRVWDAIDPAQAPADEVMELHLFDSTHIIGAGGDPDFGYGVGMIRTNDGGTTWHYDELPFQGAATSIGFRTSSEAWSPLGPRGTMIVSKDSGYTWIEVPNPDSVPVFRIVFPDSLHGWACGPDGVLLKYIPQTQGGISDRSALSVPGIQLYQNYPDPFITTTRIRFSVASSIQTISLTLKVFSIDGTQVCTLINSSFRPGTYEATFDASQLPAGIYFFRLSGDGADIVRKMAVIK